jgi:hypothetical protein
VFKLSFAKCSTAFVVPNSNWKTGAIARVRIVGNTEAEFLQTSCRTSREKLDLSRLPKGALITYRVRLGGSWDSVGDFRATMNAMHLKGSKHCWRPLRRKGSGRRFGGSEWTRTGGLMRERRKSALNGLLVLTTSRKNNDLRRLLSRNQAQEL